MLSSLAVLSLTTAGLTLGFTPAAQAADADLANRNYEVGFRSLETIVHMANDSGGFGHYFYRNDLKGHSLHGNAGGRQTIEGFSQAGAGISDLGDGYPWASEAVVEADGPGSVTKSDHGYGGTISGLGTIGDTDTDASLNLPANGEPTPLGTDLFNATVKTGAFNLDPQPVYGLTGKLDHLDGVSIATSTASSRFVAIPGSDQKAGVEFVSESGTGTYQALNGSVQIEVVKSAVGRSLNNGDATSTATYQGATVKVTGPDGAVTAADASSGQQTLTLTDPQTPGVSLNLVLNQDSSWADGTDLYLAGSTAIGTYTNTDTGVRIGTFEIGNVYSDTHVPAGGVDVSAQPDADQDGLTAFEEDQYGTSDTEADVDNDGLVDGQERARGTDPKVADSDGDGLNDGTEVALGTNPLVTDTDADGLSDAREHNDTLTNPVDADTDHDGLRDGLEVDTYSTDPSVADTDHDGLKDGAEANTYRSDPNMVDTDSGGTNDADEASAGTNPRNAGDDYLLQDTDTDGLTGGHERVNGTDPTNSDTDADGLSDGQEVNTFGTNPTVADIDEDGLNDGAEIAAGTNPYVADVDRDGLDDKQELAHGTNPYVADTDRDGLKDGAEVTSRGTDPLAADTDHDGLLDGAEIVAHTNPNVADTDKDGLLDGVEVTRYHTSPLAADTDRDRLTDKQEIVTFKTSPTKTDTDRDGLRDGVEVKGYVNRRYAKTFKSNPLKADSDRDGLSDKVEVTGARNKRFKYAPTSPTRADTDKDGTRTCARSVPGRTR